MILEPFEEEVAYEDSGKVVYGDEILACQMDEYNSSCNTKKRKKRRLTVDQVKWLEAWFEEDKNLEPHKKHRLATQLGLQPRQVAVWFQNRRARGKAKQLETSFDLLRSNYQALLKERDTLTLQVANLTAQLRLQQSTKQSECSPASTDAAPPDAISSPSQESESFFHGQFLDFITYNQLQPTSPFLPQEYDDIPTWLWP